MMRLCLLITALIAGSFTAMSQTNEPQKKGPAEMMREMRFRALSTSPSEWGQKPTTEYPHVCGVIMDWPIEAATVSVVSFSSGDASIYTTGTFGVIGGVGHDSVRSAARSFVRVGEKYFDQATVTKEFPYPQAGRVRFYLVCYDGVRVIEADSQSVASGKEKYSDLYLAGQSVITELRKITQTRKDGKP